MSDIHNYFIDHIDSDDGSHHHHGTGINDILAHKHDGTDDHDHYLRAYDNDGGSNDHYGSAVHDHGAPYYVIDNVATHDNNDNSWANDIDNITAGNPYDHTPN
jgi:hypothetical protein